MACVNVSSSASISVMELIMTTVLPELSAAPAVNDDPVAPGGGGGGGVGGLCFSLQKTFTQNPPGGRLSPAALSTHTLEVKTCCEISKSTGPEWIFFFLPSGGNQTLAVDQ